jgi:hypothetical protein
MRSISNSLKDRNVFNYFEHKKRDTLNVGGGYCCKDILHHHTQFVLINQQLNG